MIWTLLVLLFAPLAWAEIDEIPPANPTEFHNMEAERWERVYAAREQSALDETQADFDVQYYELWLDLRNFAGQQVTGRTDIHGRALISDFRDVVLDFCDTLTVDSVRGSSGQVLSYVHSNYQIVATLERDYALDEEFVFTIFYHGRPCLGGGISTFDWYNRPVSTYNVPSIATLSEPLGARDWWPCKDAPGDKADSARIHLTVVDSITATSNGLLESVTVVPSGSRQFNWFERYPISSYLIAASATNYTLFTDWYVSTSGDSLPLEYFVYPEKLAQSQADFDIMPQAIAHLEVLFGEYPFMDEKYGHTMFRWGGAMEHQCNTSYGRSIVNGAGTYDYILVHELAHQWWGDMVTLADWPHIWLNEGFASYSEALWFEHLGGATALKDYMVNSQPVTDPSGPVYDPAVLFDGNTVYNKGAWILHTLRGAIRNDSLFFAGLREYRTRYEYGAATTDDFIDAMNFVVGDDIEPFIHAYLYEVNRPAYRISYGTGTVDGVLRTAVRLRQTHSNPPVPFVNRCDLRFGGAQTVTQYAVCNSYRQEFYFDMGYTPSSITFDPDEWFLKTKFAEPLQPVILNTSLSLGSEDSPYADTLVAIGGNGNYTFSLLSGTLPAGLTFASNGHFSGTPTEGANVLLALRVQDTNNQADTTQLVLSIAALNYPPQDLTINANGDSTVTLRWLSVPGAASYDITAATLTDFSDAILLGTTTDTSFVDTTSFDQKFYFVRASH